jgi:hypothetical protein
VAECLLLIERRLAQLTEYTKMEAGSQLPVLHRRLNAAHALRSKDPDRARRLYAAIVDLCEEKSWAAGIVEEASRALAALDEAAAPAKERESGGEQARGESGPDPQ